MSKKIRRDIERAWSYFTQENRQAVRNYLHFVENLPSRKAGVMELIFQDVYLDSQNSIQGKEKWLLLPHGDLIVLWYLGWRAQHGDLRLRSVQELDLRGMNIRDFPGNFSWLESLKSLKLKGKIGDIPPGIESLVLDEETLDSIRPLLQDLTIQPKIFLEIQRPENCIPDLFENIQGISFLQEIQSIPYWLQNYRQIRYLRIPLHRIRKFPYWFSDFAALEELEIGSGGGQTVLLPDSFGRLKQLRRLVCADLGWSVFPDWITELSALRELDISGNNLARLSPDISNLRHLEHLEVQGNPISIFPDILQRVPSLGRVLIDVRQRRTWGGPKDVPLQLALNHYWSGME